MSVDNNLRRHRILYVCFTLKIRQSRRSKSKSPSKCLACPWRGFLRSRECPGTVQSGLTTSMTLPNYKSVLFAGALVLISSPNISLTNIFAVRDAVSCTCSRNGFKSWPIGRVPLLFSKYSTVLPVKFRDITSIMPRPRSCFLPFRQHHYTIPRYKICTAFSLSRSLRDRSLSVYTQTNVPLAMRDCIRMMCRDTNSCFTVFRSLKRF